MFSIAPHQRGDLLAPIIPPAALLAGREIALLLKRFRRDRVVLGATVFALAMLGVTARYYFKMAEETLVQKTLGMEQLARSIDGVPMIHVDTPFTLQFYLNTMQMITPPEKAGELLSRHEPRRRRVVRFQPGPAVDPRGCGDSRTGPMAGNGRAVRAGDQQPVDEGIGSWSTG